MNIDLDVLKKLSPTYAVVPIEYIKELKELVAGGKTGQSPEHESILTSGGYEWDDASKTYINGDQSVYAFPGAPVVVWAWQGSLARAFKDLDSFQKWITGNDKYPDGKANEFIKVYSEMTGEMGDDGGGVGVADAPNRGVGGTEFKFAGKGSRPKEPEFKQPADPTDALIFRFKKKAGYNKTLPSDEIITLGMRAKKEGNQKLLDFLKTITPLGENFVKKSDLSKLIQEIAKRIVTEIDVDEESGTSAASPVTGPMALKKKKVMDEEQIDEMTTTMSGTTGYNIPGAFSRRGGSVKGVKGSEKLGYKLTTAGKEEMKRSADKLYEGKSIKDGTPICKYCHKLLHYAGQIECHKCGKVQK